MCVGLALHCNGQHCPAPGPRAIKTKDIDFVFLLASDLPREQIVSGLVRYSSEFCSRSFISPRFAVATFSDHSYKVLHDFYDCEGLASYTAAHLESRWQAARDVGFEAEGQMLEKLLSRKSGNSLTLKKSGNIHLIITPQQHEKDSALSYTDLSIYYARKRTVVTMSFFFQNTSEFISSFGDPRKANTFSDGGHFNKALTLKSLIAAGDEQAATAQAHLLSQGLSSLTHSLSLTLSLSHTHILSLNE